MENLTPSELLTLAAMVMFRERNAASEPRALCVIRGKEGGSMGDSVKTMKIISDHRLRAA